MRKTKTNKASEKTFQQSNVYGLICIKMLTDIEISDV